MSETIGNEIAGIGFASALAGMVSFKDSGIANINDTYRGQILTSENETRFAILKDLAPRELANEVMIAILGCGLGLQIPPAYLVLVPTGSIPVRNAPSLDGGNLFFASCDVGAPSVASIMRRGASASGVRKIVEQLLAGDLSSVYELDAWCANIDRHMGNLLLSGSGIFWLIDHGHCFSGPSWKAEDLVASDTFTSRLKQWATPHLSPAEVDKLMTSIGRVASHGQQIGLRKAAEQSLVPELLGSQDFEALFQFMNDRVPAVPRLAADALGRLA